METLFAWLSVKISLTVLSLGAVRIFSILKLKKHLGF